MTTLTTTKNLYLKELSEGNLNVLGSIYSFSSDSYVLSQEEVDLLEKINDNYNVYKILGMNFYKNSNYSKFIKYYLKSLKCVYEDKTIIDDEEKYITLDILISDLYSLLNEITSVLTLDDEIDLSILEKISNNNENSILSALYVRAVIYKKANEFLKSYFDYIKLYELEYDGDIDEEYEELEKIIYSSNISFTIPEQTLKKFKNNPNLSKVLNNYYQKINPKHYVVNEYFDDELLLIIEYNLNNKNYSRAKFIIENNFNTQEKISDLINLLKSLNKNNIYTKIMELIN